MLVNALRGVSTLRSFSDYLRDLFVDLPTRRPREVGTVLAAFAAAQMIGAAIMGRLSDASPGLRGKRGLSQSSKGRTRRRAGEGVGSQSNAAS